MNRSSPPATVQLRQKICSAIDLLEQPHDYKHPTKVLLVEALALLSQSLPSAVGATKAKLSDSLNMHNRHVTDAVNALRSSQGHVCDARQALEAIKQRSEQTMKANSEWAEVAPSETRTFSDFIRNASPEEKEKVYAEVMEKASERQRTVSSERPIADFAPYAVPEVMDPNTGRFSMVNGGEQIDTPATRLALELARDIYKHANTAGVCGLVFAQKITEAVNEALRLRSLRSHVSPSRAAEEVIAERQRQIASEGWTAEHDEQHYDRDLARAALSYVKHYVERQWVFAERPAVYASESMPDEWPWAEDWWKPKNPRRDLIRAAALIVAEIDRCDRIASARGESRGG